MAFSERTPDYNRPPVVETYLGVQFAPLGRFSIPNFGLYWAKIRDRYPEFQIQPALGPVVERFGADDLAKPKLEVELMTVPEVRCWFIDQSGRMLTQVQRDRFIHNWRKLKPDDVYVHYDRIKPSFISEWNAFCGFLSESNLGKPEVNQCEMTYINHIQLGQGWKDYGELKKVIASWSGVSSGDFLPAPESVSLGVRYILPNKSGRLHVEMQPAVTRDGKEILQLNLTARGQPRSSNLDEMLEWFDLGHEWIVRGFTDFTAKDMHDFWGRKV